MAYKLIEKHFNSLSTKELYDIMSLRQEVFIVEQTCPYLDADYKDQEGFHIMFMDKETLVAYSRILGPGISYPDYSSIGRVLNKMEYRNQGFGKKLMEHSINACISRYPDNIIKISAQKYLLKFYTDLGFEKIGAEYLEDDIPHLAMIYDKHI